MVTGTVSVGKHYKNGKKNKNVAMLTSLVWFWDPQPDDMHITPCSVEASLVERGTTDTA